MSSSKSLLVVRSPKIANWHTLKQNKSKIKQSVKSKIKLKDNRSVSKQLQCVEELWLTREYGLAKSSTLGKMDSAIGKIGQFGKILSAAHSAYYESQGAEKQPNKKISVSKSKKMKASSTEGQRTCESRSSSLGQMNNLGDRNLQNVIDRCSLILKKYQTRASELEEENRKLGQINKNLKVQIKSKIILK